MPSTTVAAPVGIENFHAYDEFWASGAQPNGLQLADLKQNGYEAVVNLSPASTRNALRDEAAIVATIGMDYLHWPVDCSRLRPIHYLAFRGIMSALEGKKTLVHCGGNIKSSNLLHMYFVLEKGIPEELSLAELKTIQDPEAKWFEYFKSMGMQALGRSGTDLPNPIGVSQ